MSEYDEDGFRRFISDTPEALQFVKAPPPTVEMPDFFDGCSSHEDGVFRVIDLLGQSFSVEQHGIDEMYRRLSLALTILLARNAGLEP